MKILATSDLHGCAMAAKMLQTIDQTHPDLVLICGDVSGFSSTKLSVLSRNQSKEVQGLDAMLGKLDVPARYILGNDDWCESDGDHYLCAPELFNGLEFMPFEWVHTTPFGTNREANENKIEYELRKILDPEDVEAKARGQNMVVVAHMPPYAAGDILGSGAHCGSRRIADWISKVQPRLWLCGHIHEDFSINKIGETLVANCACRHEQGRFQAWLIDTDTLDFEKIRLYE